MRVVPLLLVAILSAGEIPVPVAPPVVPSPPPPPSGPLTEADRAFLDQVRARQTGLKSISAAFTRRVRRIDEPAEAGRACTGELDLLLPDRFAVTFDGQDGPGTKLRLVSDGERIWEQQRFDPESPPDPPKIYRLAEADPVVRRLLACARLDLDALARDFRLGVAGPADGDPAGVKRLLLTPIDQQVAREVSRIELALDAGLAPLRVVYDDPQGNRHVHAITRFTRDGAIAPEKLAPPAPGQKP